MAEYYPGTGAIKSLIPLASGTVVCVPSTCTAGVATTFSRGDHSHGGSIGPGSRTLTNQTGVRAAGVVYTNSSTNGMLVMITLTFSSAFAGSGLSQTFLNADANNPPVANESTAKSQDTDPYTQAGTLIGYVKPGDNFELNVFAGAGASVTIETWWELLF